MNLKKQIARMIVMSCILLFGCKNQQADDGDKKAQDQAVWNPETDSIEMLHSKLDQLSVAWRYEHGDDVIRKNCKKAIDAYSRLAVQGDMAAELHLGFMYDQGKCVKKNTEKATYHFNRVKKLGENSDAQNYLRTNVSFGAVMVEPDNKILYEQLYDWLKERALSGDADAQLSMSTMYNAGLGIRTNEKEVRRWTSMAAQNGKGQLSLGLLYERGIGVPQDYMLARKIYLNEANRGDYAFQNNIGWTYILDEKHQDYVEAYKWLALAWLKYPKKGDGFSGDIVEKMTVEQISEAKNRITNWLSIYTKDGVAKNGRLIQIKP